MTPELKGFLFFSVIRLLAIFTALLVSVAMLTLVERKLAGWFQNRPGPNRVGPWGLLQPAADGLKNILKEETRPAGANQAMFILAPALAFTPALMLLAVIPLAAPLPVNVDWTLPLIGRITYDGMMPISITELPIGFLFVLALSSMGVYGVAIAGWSSNSKYSLLGGLRASAQMVSYEVALGLSLIPVLLVSGNVGFAEIIQRQQEGLWFVGPLFLSFFLFLVSGFAETNRLPFDLPEAESELVAGYHSEYSAMKFSMFYIAEYAHIITVAAMMASLFFGGWDIPFTDWDEQGGALQTLATHLAFLAKTFFWIFFVIWIRWTLPRFRYDQLMALGWKVMLPVALAYVMIMAITLWLLDLAMPAATPVMRALILTVFNLGLAAVFFLAFDRGRVIGGSSSRRVSPTMQAEG